MPADQKTLQRLSKLLRLAGPSSGTSEAERASAALEAARLIEEHDIDFGAEKPQRASRSTGRASVKNVWVLSMAPYNCGCAECHKPISKSDIVWIKVQPDLGVLYRHNYGRCKLE